MFKKFKYVIIGDIAPRVCSECESHHELTGGFNVTSAGWGRIEQNEAGEFSVVTFGESIGLKLKPAENDAYLLKRLFFGYD